MHKRRGKENITFQRESLLLQILQKKCLPRLRDRMITDGREKSREPRLAFQIYSRDVRETGHSKNKL